MAPVQIGYGLGLTDPSDVNDELRLHLQPGGGPIASLQDLSKLMSQVALFEDAYLHIFGLSEGVSITVKKVLISFLYLTDGFFVVGSTDRPLYESRELGNDQQMSL
jgi:hypothetical protein